MSSTYPFAGKNCDIVLVVNSIRYPLMLYPKNSLRGYSEGDASDWAPRVASGPPTYSDLDAYNMITQEGWEHGFGFVEFADELGYAYSEVNLGGAEAYPKSGVDTRRGGVVQLATTIASSDATGYRVNKFADYGTSMYAACQDDGGVGTYTGSAWTFNRDINGDTVNEDCYDLLDAGDFLFACIESPATSTVVDSYASGDDGYAELYGANWEAQTFLTSSAYTIAQVGLKLRRVGSPGTVTVSIRATTAGVPSGSDLASGTTNGNKLTADAGGEWKKITLTTPYDLVTATTYAIVVRATGGSATNTIRWRADTSSPTYTNGSRCTSTNSGTDWTADTTDDFMFRTYANADCCIFRSPDGTVWDEVNLSSTDYPRDRRYLAKGGGYLWSSEKDGNRLQYDSNADGSGFQDWEDDPVHIIVGASDVPITSLCWWKTNMYVGKEDSLYMITEQMTPILVLPFHNERATWNFKDMCVGSDGYLYFIIRDRIYRYAGNQPIDITPGHWGIEQEPGTTTYELFTITPTKKRKGGTALATGTKPPYVYYNKFHSMCKVGGEIWVVGRTSGNLRHWLAWNGRGWHHLYTLTDSDNAVEACYYSTALSKVFCSLDLTTNAIHSVQLNTGSNWPYASYPTGDTSTRIIYFSKMHLGLLEVVKYLDSLKTRCYALEYAAEGDQVQIEFEYQIDEDGTWRDIATNPLRTEGMESTDFPSTYNTCKVFQLRAKLTTNDSAKTPYLDAFAVKLVPRPSTIYQYPLTIEVRDDQTMLDGSTNPFDARQIKAALRAARDSQVPITVETPWESKTVMVRTYSFSGLGYEDNVPVGVAVLSMIEM